MMIARQSSATLPRKVEALQQLTATAPCFMTNLSYTTLALLYGPLGPIAVNSLVFVDDSYYIAASFAADEEVDSNSVLHSLHGEGSFYKYQSAS